MTKPMKEKWIEVKDAEPDEGTELVTRFRGEQSGVLLREYPDGTWELMNGGEIFTMEAESARAAQAEGDDFVFGIVGEVA